MSSQKLKIRWNIFAELIAEKYLFDDCEVLGIRIVAKNSGSSRMTRRRVLRVCWRQGCALKASTFNWNNNQHYKFEELSLIDVGEMWLKGKE